MCVCVCVAYAELSPLRARPQKQTSGNTQVMWPCTTSVRQRNSAHIKSCRSCTCVALSLSLSICSRMEKKMIKMINQRYFHGCVYLHKDSEQALKNANMYTRKQITKRLQQHHRYKRLRCNWVFYLHTQKIANKTTSTGRRVVTAATRGGNTRMLWDKADRFNKKYFSTKLTRPLRSRWCCRCP